MLYETAGWSKDVLVQEFGIAGCPLVDTRAKFLAPSRYGEDVTIVSSFADIRNSSFDIRHELSKDGKLRVEGFETRVWTVRDTETGRIKSAPLPEIVAARFRGEK